MEPAATGYPTAVAVVAHVIPVRPERVFEVLSDGWSYSDWVVGTAHIRDVDPAWPAPGSRIHHKAGPWPMSLHDRTEVLDCRPPTDLVLRPHLWPLGAVRVHLHLEPEGEGATRVTLAEDVEAGPVRWVRTKLNDLLLHYRNRESLRRLADIAAGRQVSS